MKRLFAPHEATMKSCVKSENRCDLQQYNRQRSLGLTSAAKMKEINSTAALMRQESQFFDNQIDKPSEDSADCRVESKPMSSISKRNRIRPTETLSNIHSAWLSTQAAAKYLSTTAGAIRNRVHRGQLTRYYLGRSLRFKKSELDRLLETSKKGGFNGS